MAFIFKSYGIFVSWFESAANIFLNLDFALDGTAIHMNVKYREENDDLFTPLLEKIIVIKRDDLLYGSICR